MSLQPQPQPQPQPDGEAAPVADDGVALEARDIRVAFGGIQALAGVDVAFRRGTISGLIGPNGAGKTTLFDCLSGVRPPTAGSILLDGVDVTGRSASWRSRHGLRRTFQRQQTFGHLTVEDNLLVATEWRGGGGGLLGDLVRLPGRRSVERRRRREADEVLDLCELGDVRGQLAGSLPIAQARMVELARALVDRPSVLLLDEPTSGLDEVETERLGALVERARQAQGCTVVIVEHDVGFLVRHVDHLVALDLGEVLAAGSPGVVRADERVRRAYLGAG